MKKIIQSKHNVNIGSISVILIVNYSSETYEIVTNKNMYDFRFVEQSPSRLEYELNVLKVIKKAHKLGTKLINKNNSKRPF